MLGLLRALLVGAQERLRVLHHLAPELLVERAHDRDDLERAGRGAPAHLDGAHELRGGLRHEPRVAAPDAQLDVRARELDGHLVAHRVELLAGLGLPIAGPADASGAKASRSTARSTRRPMDPSGGGAGAPPDRQSLPRAGLSLGGAPSGRGGAGLAAPRAPATLPARARTREEPDPACRPPPTTRTRARAERPEEDRAARRSAGGPANGRDSRAPTPEQLELHRQAAALLRRPAGASSRRRP